MMRDPSISVSLFLINEKLFFYIPVRKHPQAFKEILRVNVISLKRASVNCSGCLGYSSNDIVYHARAVAITSLI